MPLFSRVAASTWRLLCRLLLITAGSALCLSSPSQSKAQPSRSTLRPISVDDEVTVREPDTVLISPDGKWVFYVVRDNDLTSNRTVPAAYLVGTKAGARPRQILGAFTDGQLFAFAWGHDSKQIFFVRTDELGAQHIAAFNVELNHERSVLVLPAGAGDGFARLAGAVLPSPDGGSLAVIVEKPIVIQPQPAMDPERGFRVPSPDYRAPTARPAYSDVNSQSQRIREIYHIADLSGRYATNILYTYDMNGRRLREVTSDSYNVLSANWSPTNNELVFAAASGAPKTMYVGMEAKIYVATLESHVPRLVVGMPGSNSNPVWSPDGKLIAFLTQHGVEDWMYEASVAVVDPFGGNMRDLGQTIEKEADVSIESDLHWEGLGDILVGGVQFRLGHHLFEIGDQGARRITPRLDRDYSNFSWTPDGKVVAFVVEGVGVPPEIYVSSTDRFSPRQLTHLGIAWDSLARPHCQIIEWPSSDGKWKISGLLITPPNFIFGRRYPMLVLAQGGPTMVTQTVRPVDNYPILTLADEGYVVLAPNTRGRGGFGSDFRHAIGTEKSYVGLPAEDVTGGVNAVIARGIADPHRMGIIGYSYGETLSLAVLMHDNRFKAAVVGGGSPALFLRVLDLNSTNETDRNWALWRDMYGFPNRYDPENLKSMYDQTAMFHANAIKTPILLEDGELELYVEQQEFYRWVLHFGLPAEHVIYPGVSHGWQNFPKLLQDSYRHDVAWLDYWLLDKPYTDALLQVSYDHWKAGH